MITPRTPPGVLELLPADQAAFRRMLDTIRSTYERFGFVEIETPVFEMSDVLLTKTGGETERQIYFVQATGAIDRNGLPDLALRFDLTVPLARYVAEHQNDLAFPFKRYQIQRVYRGERPQKGRFREFYQCDIDVIGRDAQPPTRCGGTGGHPRRIQPYRDRSVHDPDQPPGPHDRTAGPGGCRVRGAPRRTC
jgi:histidyl-tRNA synthetase